MTMARLRRKQNRVPLGEPSSSLLLLGFIFISGCAKWEEPQRWLVTVEVETPEGLRTGSGVVETHYRPRHEIIYTMDSPQRRVEGEAIAVETSEGIVFALLDREGDYGFYRTHLSGYGWAPGPDGRLRRFELNRGNDPELRDAAEFIRDRRERSREQIQDALAAGRSFELLEEGWPRFVLLPDSDDPKSAVLLAPTDTEEAVVGDIRVRRITVQATDEPVTASLAARLPWLSGGALPISGRRVYPPQIPADLLGPEEFSTLLD